MVTIASPDPPEGHVISTRDNAPAAFVGWLGLIRLLADAVAPIEDIRISSAIGFTGRATNHIREAHQ